MTQAFTAHAMLYKAYIYIIYQNMSSLHATAYCSMVNESFAMPFQELLGGCLTVLNNNIMSSEIERRRGK